MHCIERKFTFEAAHTLSCLEDGHPCKSIHGHSYKCFIKIYAYKLDDDGFIIDFNRLKDFQKEVIDKELDHSVIVGQKEQENFYINTIKQKVHILPKEFPTSTVENLSKYIHDKLIDFFKSIKFTNYYRIRVKLFETEKNCAYYDGV